MPKFEDCTDIDKRVSVLVKTAIRNSASSQRDVASLLGIKESSLSQMLSGVAPLPVERFFQIVGIIRPDRTAVNEIFALYQKKYSIPPSAIALLDGGWVMQRYNTLLEIPESELSEFNRKELEVIRGWLNIEIEVTPAKPNAFRERLHELVDRLADSDCELAAALLERMLNAHNQ